MHSASAVDIYRAQRKHINYSISPMRISRHDLRRRYSNSLVMDAGSQFSLRACSQAKLSQSASLTPTSKHLINNLRIKKVNTIAEYNLKKYIFIVDDRP
jgi:hypothetical protein